MFKKNRDGLPKRKNDLFTYFFVKKGEAAAWGSTLCVVVYVVEVSRMSFGTAGNVQYIITDKLPGAAVPVF